MALLLLGCPVSAGQQQSTTFANGGKRAELSCPRDSSERVDVGSWRGTGRPDVARVFVRKNGATVLSCREVDLNGDGRKDLLVFYLPDGRKLREEFDHDYDGIADVKSYYEAGLLVRQELDINYDGKPDLLEHYEGGRLARTEKLWENPEPTASSSKPDGKTDGKTDGKMDGKTDGSRDVSPTGTAPASAAGSGEAGAASRPSTADRPAAAAETPLLPAESTPRGITPALPPPQAVPETPPSPSPR